MLQNNRVICGKSETVKSHSDFLSFSDSLIFPPTTPSWWFLK